MIDITIQNHHAMRDGRPVPFRESPNVGTGLKPEYIVLHDTASGLKADGPIGWLTSRESKVSAHFVVGRDGSITQLVPMNVRAFHAGQSIWKGRQFLNGFSIGIEIVNPGKMQKIGDNKYKSLATIDVGLSANLRVERRSTQAHGDGYWLHYSPEQVRAVTELCQAICGAYDIKDILTHWMISPGRKVDVNPLFPLDAVKQKTLGVRPIGLMQEPVAQDSDESAGADEGDAFDAPHGMPDTDESAGGIDGVWKLVKSKIAWATGSLGGLSIGSFLTFLQDWRVMAVLCVTVIAIVALVLYERSKKP
jgi:N-acetyl-anhydromuramyl-L-alanine amidase AmpD